MFLAIQWKILLKNLAILTLFFSHTFGDWNPSKSLHFQNFFFQIFTKFYKEKKEKANGVPPWNSLE
jgi:hypothetical protein